MPDNDIPGVAVVVVDDQGILWAEGHGFTGPVTPANTLTAFLTIPTSLCGLIYAGMQASMARLVYSGFLSWLDPPLWQKLLPHALLGLAVCAVALVDLAIRAWKQAGWGQRWSYTVLGWRRWLRLLCSLVGGWPVWGRSFQEWLAILFTLCHNSKAIYFDRRGLLQAQQQIFCLAFLNPQRIRCFGLEVFLWKTKITHFW